MRLWIALIVCTSVSSNSFANDASFGDANGSIVFLKQTDVQMVKEVLDISTKRITVDYSFVNHSPVDVVLPMAFPMPPMFFGSMDHSKIQHFKLWVNQQPMKTTRRFVVLLNGQDISVQATALGWRENDLMLGMREGFSGKLKPSQKTLPRHWFNQDEALFTLNEYFVWEQRFPAKQTVQIKHTYEPAYSSGVPQDAASLMLSFEKSSCLDAQAKQYLAKHQKGSAQGLSWRNLQYILTTGNNWRGAIGEFTLRIHKQTPQELMSLCFDGELKKTSTLTFEFKQSNYSPGKELNILFASAYQPQ